MSSNTTYINYAHVTRYHEDDSFPWKYNPGRYLALVPPINGATT